MDYPLEKGSKDFVKYKEKFDNLLDHIIHDDVEFEVLNIWRASNVNMFTAEVGIGRTNEFRREHITVMTLKVTYEALMSIGANPVERPREGNAA